MPLDEVIYCDIRFDDEISGETPEMFQFIQKAEKILKNRWNINVTHIRGNNIQRQKGDVWETNRPRADYLISIKYAEEIKG